jgi:hypothetical protein
MWMAHMSMKAGSQPHNRAAALSPVSPIIAGSFGAKVANQASVRMGVTMTSMTQNPITKNNDAATRKTSSAMDGCRRIRNDTTVQPTMSQAFSNIE